MAMGACPHREISERCVLAHPGIARLDRCRDTDRWRVRYREPRVDDDPRRRPPLRAPPRRGLAYGHRSRRPGRLADDRRPGTIGQPALAALLEPAAALAEF